MLLGDLLTTVQESLPVKIAVYDNGKLGFVDIEQKAAGMLPLYTDLKNRTSARLPGRWAFGDGASRRQETSKTPSRLGFPSPDRRCCM